ncbi:MAG: hypothetical protein CBC35_12255 [Planctomycetes bacterium TMED75]|nr:hypothetical protein [Planctomycetaceae bacterium]OUU90126.1 MAG: hypothetical protein CBC35_12255 [Planctomycetes bacterium TMED75]
MVPSPEPMRVLAVYNPVAGSGRGERIATALVSGLEGSPLPSGGCVSIHAEPSQPRPARAWLDPLLTDVEVLVVIGGDGACRLAAPSAMRAGIPLYHYAAGTENLFSRDHGMQPEPKVLLRALKQGTQRRVDVLRVEGELGLLFASVGFDAEVIHDLARHRSGSISHLSYTLPIIRQLLSWHRRRTSIEIEVDGTRLNGAAMGLGLIANSPQYALRVNPALDARVDDGVLDVVGLPARTLVGLFLWALRCRFRRPGSPSRRLRARGRTIVLHLAQPANIQIDGDPPQAENPRSRYEIQIEPGALLVLRPPSENRAE